MADFSNRAGVGVKDYVMAPGVSVYSTLPRNRYASWDGTSMATPQVAGIAALMMQARPNLTAPQIEALLIQSARPDGVAPR
jgi:subtilisin family serine protease